MPEHFMNNGYISASFGKVFHPGPSSGHTDDFPFSWTMAPFHGISEKYKNSPVCPPLENSTDFANQKFASNLVCPVKVDQQPFKTLPDIESTQAVVGFLNNFKQLSSNVTKKFFIALGFNKPHIPLKFPKEYLELYPLAEIKLSPDRRGWPLFTPPVAYETWSDVRSRADVKELNLTFPVDWIPDQFQVRSLIPLFLGSLLIDSFLINQTCHHINLVAA